MSHNELHPYPRFSGRPLENSLSVLLYLLVTLSALPAWAKTTAFYTCAHPDDCVLFMNPNLYDDITANADKVVMVYLTSGDGGEAFARNYSFYPFAREQASLEATQWMVGIKGKQPRAETKMLNLNGHKIEQVSYGNATSYFLRLPDGAMEGTGFERYKFQSMQKLLNGEITRLIPVDDKGHYKSWQDLTGVLSTIIRREAPEGHISLHMAETDPGKNPSDHSDHTTAAAAMLDALGDRCADIYSHTGYSIAERPQNIDANALQNKAGSFAVLTAALSRLHGIHHWDATHRSYLPHNYFSKRSTCNGASS